MSRWLWLPFSFLLMSGPAVAVSPADSAQLVVSNTTTRLLAVLKERREEIRANPQAIYGLVDEIILPHFDFARMSRWVLGRHWRGATPEQQQRFVEEFRTLLVRTYATALSEYSDQEVTFLPTRAAPDATDVTIRTEVRQPGGFPIPIHYTMHVEGGKWRVFDVTIDGVSLVSTYRSAFSTEVTNRGFEGLLSLLEERNRAARP